MAEKSGTRFKVGDVVVADSPEGIYPCGLTDGYHLIPHGTVGVVVGLPDIRRRGATCRVLFLMGRMRRSGVLSTWPWYYLSENLRRTDAPLDGGKP